MSVPRTAGPHDQAAASPAAPWLRHYRGRWLRGDRLGALTAWALIVPECVYALLGRSNFLLIGATSAAAVLSAATVSAVGPAPEDAVGLSAALAVIVGAVLLAAGPGRLGFLTSFLAEPALVGFLFGMALTIVVRQAAKLVGVAGGDGNFFERLWTALSGAPHWSLVTLAVGAAALAALFLLERFVPRLPASLIALVAALLLSAALGLEGHGVETVGRIPSAQPVRPGTRPGGGRQPGDGRRRPQQHRRRTLPRLRRLRQRLAQRGRGRSGRPDPDGLADRPAPSSPRCSPACPSRSSAPSSSSPYAASCGSANSAAPSVWTGAACGSRSPPCSAYSSSTCCPDCCSPSRSPSPCSPPPAGAASPSSSCAPTAASSSATSTGYGWTRWSGCGPPRGRPGPSSACARRPNSPRMQPISLYVSFYQEVPKSEGFS